MKREAELERMQRLIGLLEDWARWMQAGHVRQGHHRSAIFCGAGQDFEDMADDVSRMVNEAISAAIESLPPAQAAAINRRYGICAVWRFPRHNYADLLQAAHDALIVSLPRRNVVL